MSVSASPRRRGQSPALSSPVHVETAQRVAAGARRLGIEQLVHISGSVPDAQSRSPYSQPRPRRTGCSDIPRCHLCPACGYVWIWFTLTGCVTEPGGKLVLLRRRPVSTVHRCWGAHHRIRLRGGNRACPASRWSRLCSRSSSDICRLHGGRAAAVRPH
jgi:hypothetical protein